MTHSFLRVPNCWDWGLGQGHLRLFSWLNLPFGALFSFACAIPNPNYNPNPNQVAMGIPLNCIPDVRRVYGRDPFSR